MKANVIRLAVDFTVNEGQLEEFKKAAQAMTAGSEAESGTLGYEWFLSADQRSGRLLETYVDAAAVEAHFAGPVVRELVLRVMPFCQIVRFEIYGDPGEAVTKTAAGFGAQIYEYWTGLTR